MNNLPELDVSRILHGLYRRKGLIICVFFVVFTLAVYLATILPDVYRSSTMVLVTPQKIPAGYVRSTVTINLDERMRTIVQQILSRSHLEKIVEEFRLYETTMPGAMLDARVAALRKKISFQIVRNNAFQISFASDHPETAMRVTNRLGGLFIEENLQAREQQAIGTTAFLNSELERIRKELEGQEVQVNQFKSLHRFELPDQLDANLRTLAQLRAQLESSVARLSLLHDRKGSLEKQVIEAEITAPEIVTVMGGSASERERIPPQEVSIQSRRQQLKTLLQKYSAKHPDVIQAKNELSRLEAESAKVPSVTSNSAIGLNSTGGNPIKQLLEKQIVALDSEAKLLQMQIEQLRSQVNLYQSRVDNTPMRGIELSKISRTYDITLRKYQDLLGKSLESQLSENMEKKQKGEQFQIVDAANLPRIPVSPNRQLIILFGLVGGLAGGLLLAFVWENLDRSLKHADEVSAYVNLPLLVSIPALATRGAVLERRRGQGILVLASVGTIAFGMICLRIFAPLYF